jgi:hypothetical protein
MKYRIMKKLINLPRKGLISPFLGQNVGVSFVVGKEVIRSNLIKEHLNRWKACKSCCQSKTLMSESLSSGTEKLQDRIKRRWGC